MDAMDEVAIDLDEVGAHLRNDEHARVSRARIVDGDAEAARAEVGDNTPEARDVRHRHALADLEDDVFGMHPGAFGELGGPACSASH